MVGYAITQAIGILRREQPDVVVGFGGFASGPGGVAARVLGKPLVIHEQNAIAGTTNRLLARIATRVLSAFNGAFAQAQVVGNPVRTAIAALPAPAVRYGERRAQKAKLHVLVLGGSLGAKAINELVPEALAQLPAESRPDVWHQAGKDHSQTTAVLYEQQRVTARVDAFIDDMAAAYGWADVIVCRAGAGTSVAQRELTPAKLAALLMMHINEPEQSMNMAEKARLLALPNAAETVANICVEVARG